MGNFQHIGLQTPAHRHRTCIDDRITRFDKSTFFENIRAILDGLIGGGKTVVKETLYPPQQVEGAQTDVIVAKNKNGRFGAEATDLKGGIARGGMSDNAFCSDLFGYVACTETDHIRMIKHELWGWYRTAIVDLWPVLLFCFADNFRHVLNDQSRVFA